MKTGSFFILLFIFQISAWAQQCPFPNDYYYVLSLQNAPQEKVNIQLVNDKNEPILIHQRVNRKSKVKAVPTEFVKGKKFDQRHQLPMSWNNYYVASVRFTKEKPIFQALITVKKGKKIDSTLIRLPLDKAINRCRNQSNFYLNRTIYHLDQTPFEPIEVEVGKSTQREIPDTIQRLLFYPEWSQKDDNAMFRLKSIAIVDEYSLKTVQKLVPTENTNAFLFHHYDTLKAIRPIVSTRNKQSTLPDLWITRKKEKNLDETTTTYQTIYQWNTELKQYKENVIWSNTPNIQWNQYTHQVEYSTRKETLDSTHFITYQWQAPNWKIVKKRSRAKPKIDVNSCLQHTVASYQLLPVIENKTDEYFITLSDSFEVKNRCSEELICPDFMVPNFQLPASIAAQSSATIHLFDSVPNHKNTIAYRFSRLPVDWVKNHAAPPTFAYFFAHKSRRIYNSNQQVIGYQKPSADNYQQRVLYVDSLRFPTAWGNELSHSHQRIGTWQIWSNPNHLPHQETYSKSVLLSVPNLTHEPYQLEVLSDSGWTYKESVRFPGVIRFEVFPNQTDYRIRQNHEISEFSCDYLQIYNLHRMVTYFIGAHQKWVMDGATPTPIQWHNQYVIHYSDEFYKSLPHSEEKWKNLLAEIQKKHPKWHFFFNEEQQIEVHTEEQQSVPAQKMLAHLVNNHPYLRGFSRKLTVAGRPLTFFDQTVILKIESYATMANILPEIEKLGFTYFANSHTNGTFRFKYSSPAFSVEMLEKFNQLFTLEPVKEGWLSYYHKAEPEPLEPEELELIRISE